LNTKVWPLFLQSLETVDVRFYQNGLKAAFLAIILFLRSLRPITVYYDRITKSE